MRKQNLSLQSTFPIKFYQTEKDPTVGQISNKDVQCFLCLVVTTLNPWKRNKLTPHFLEKQKQHTVNNKIINDDLDDELFLKSV